GKPVKAATAPAGPRDWKKHALPAVLVGLIVAVLIWRATPKPPPPVDLTASKPKKTDWIDPPKEGSGLPSSFALGEDPALDLIREIIAQATSGDGDEAAK